MTKAALKKLLFCLFKKDKLQKDCISSRKFCKKAQSQKDFFRCRKICYVTHRFSDVERFSAAKFSITEIVSQILMLYRNNFSFCHDYLCSLKGIFVNFLQSISPVLKVLFTLIACCLRMRHNKGFQHTAQ